MEYSYTIWAKFPDFWNNVKVAEFSYRADALDCRRHLQKTASFKNAIITIYEHRVRRSTKLL